MQMFRMDTTLLPEGCKINVLNVIPFPNNLRNSATQEKFLCHSLSFLNYSALAVRAGKAEDFQEKNANSSAWSNFCNNYQVL